MSIWDGVWIIVLRLKFFICLIVLSLLSACASSPEKIKLDSYESNNADIYFVPIGNMSDKYKLELLTQMEKTFPLKFSFTPYLKLRKEMIDSDKKQVFADKLLQYIDKDYGDYSTNDKAIYIGITHINMRASKESGNYIYNQRYKNNFAVISNLNMQRKAMGHFIEVDTVLANTRKMISRNIGLLKYNKLFNQDPYSVMYGRITGLLALDLIQESSVATDVLPKSVVSK